MSYYYDDVKGRRFRYLWGENGEWEAGKSREFVRRGGLCICAPVPKRGLKLDVEESHELYFIPFFWSR